MGSINKIAVENIIRRMKRAKLSQVRLAKLAKINTVQLNRILKLKRGLGPKSAAKIAHALGCDPEDLVQAVPHEPTQGKPELIADVIGALPTLNEDQLRAILATVRSFSSSG